MLASAVVAAAAPAVRNDPRNGRPDCWETMPSASDGLKVGEPIAFDPADGGLVYLV